MFIDISLSNMTYKYELLDYFCWFGHFLSVDWWYFFDQDGLNS